MVILEYDAKHTLSYGYWRCTVCDNTFYGGGKAIHAPMCSVAGYDKCNYVIGPTVVAEAKGWATTHGETGIMPLDLICLQDIWQQLPEVV